MDYNALVDKAQVFFAGLDANNDRDWFEPRKEDYARDIKAPGEAFAAEMADILSAKCGVPLSAKVFRIHRDVRFSKDKRPYKPHLHMLWADEAPEHMAWFFGIEKDRLRFGTGVFRMDGPMLARWREMIDRDGTEIAAEIDRLEARHGAQFSSMGPEPLKTVPKPYAADHPQAELLKRKSFGLFTTLPGNWRETGLPAAVASMTDAFLPLWKTVAAAF